MKNFKTVIWTPGLSGDGTGIFPGVIKGQPVKVEVLTSTLKSQRRIRGKAVCTIRPLGIDLETEVLRSEISE